MVAVQVHPPDPRGDVAEGALITSDFVECYEAHYLRLIRALRLDGADAPLAEDVAQEAFARALARWRRVRKGPNPPGYVYTTAFRLLAKTQRRSGRTLPTPVSAESADASTPPYLSPTEVSATSTVAVERALVVMPARRRACAVMCLIVGLSVQEAATALGIADGTVRKHLEEARRDLRAAVDPSV
jgi:RNA polymerase sigma-70 factor (ECF subfamily)